MKRLLFRVAIGLTLGCLAAAVAPARRPPGGPDPWVEALALGPGCFQDETTGPLGEVVVHYAPEMGERLAPVYSELFAALEPETTVHVVTRDGAAFEDLESRLALLGRPVRPRLLPEPVGHPVSGWAKDRFVSWAPERPGPLPRGDGLQSMSICFLRLGFRFPASSTASPERILLVPPRPAATGATRLGDWSVPGELAARSAGRWRSAVVPLAFDGGDFAAAEDLVLAGWMPMTKNPELADSGPREAGRLLSALAGKPVLLLGSGPDEVPEHHVNMYAIPLDGRRALVGDVRSAAIPLGGEEEARRRLGAARWDAAAPGDDNPRAAALSGDFSPEVARRFDRVAEELAAAGLEVTRIPVVPLAGGGAYGAYVTYTNALIETFADGRRRVYLPVYGLADLDRQAQRTWEGLGFEVRPVNVAPVFRFGGTLDCLVGVIERFPEAPFPKGK